MSLSLVPKCGELSPEISGVVRHYLNLNEIYGEQFTNADADEFCATALAATVAMHYLSENTTIVEFWDAVKTKEDNQATALKRFLKEAVSN